METKARILHNFTEVEWSALTQAVDYYFTVIEDDPERYGAQKPKALDRAYKKAHQLAPETPNWLRETR